MAPSAQRQYTLRDMVLAQRDAFVRGFRHPRLGRGAPDDEELARYKYPLPKVTRPRVVKIGFFPFRCIEGRIEIDTNPERAYPSHAERWAAYLGHIYAHGAHDLRAFADLLANPTETVDAEE